MLDGGGVVLEESRRPLGSDYMIFMNLYSFFKDDIGEEVIKVQDSLPPEQSGKPMAHGVADRLDVLMEVFLGYIHSVCYPNGELHSPT